MIGRLLAGVAGSLTGMALGGILIAAVCLIFEQYGGIKFFKEPLVLIVFVGVPVGGLVGGLVGLWSAGRSSPGDGPRDPI